MRGLRACTRNTNGPVPSHGPEHGIVRHRAQTAQLRVNSATRGARLRVAARLSVVRRRVVVGGAWRHFNGMGQHMADLRLNQRYEVIALALTL